MKRFPIVLTSLAPPSSVPSRRKGPPVRPKPGASNEWKPGTPGERAAALASLQLRTVIAHIRKLFSDKFSALEGVLQSISELEKALTDVEKAIERGELSVGNARLDDDEAVSGLDHALEHLGEAAFDGEDEATEFALAMVDYWIHDVLRSQGFAFLSVLTGSTGAFEVIESIEQLETVRYPG
jgi:hypothetical protein